MLHDGRRKPLFHLQPVTANRPTLSLSCCRGGSAPRFAASRPGSGQSLADENVSDIPALDADRRQGPAIAVGALAQDFDTAAFQKLGQPDLRLQREAGFMRALPPISGASMLKIRTASDWCPAPNRIESPSQTRISADSQDTVQSMTDTTIWLSMANGFHLDGAKSA